MNETIAMTTPATPDFQKIGQAFKAMFADPHKDIMAQRKDLKQQEAQLRAKIKALREQDKANLEAFKKFRDERKALKVAK